MRPGAIPVDRRWQAEARDPENRKEREEGRVRGVPEPALQMESGVYLGVSGSNLLEELENRLGSLVGLGEH